MKTVTVGLFLLMLTMYVLGVTVCALVVCVCVVVCTSSGEWAQIGNLVYRVIDFPVAQEVAGY